MNHKRIQQFFSQPLSKPMQGHVTTYWSQGSLSNISVSVLWNARRNVRSLVQNVSHLVSRNPRRSVFFMTSSVTEQQKEIMFTNRDMSIMRDLIQFDYQNQQIVNVTIDIHKYNWLKLHTNCFVLSMYSSVITSKCKAPEKGTLPAVHHS